MKNIQYILLFTIFFHFNLYAGSANLVTKMAYNVSYDKALKKAKESNKPLMMVIGQEGCPWCNKFEVKTLMNKKIHSNIENSFVPLTIIRELDQYPKRFKPKGVPTVLFIDPKNENAFYKSFGYKSKREYKIELEKALTLFKENQNI